MVYKKEDDRSKTLIALLYFLIVFALAFSFFLYTQIPIIKRAPEPPSFQEFYGTAKCDSGTNIDGVTLVAVVTNTTSSLTFNTNIQAGAYSIIVSGTQTGDLVTFFIGGNQVGLDTYTQFTQVNKNFVQPQGQAGCPTTSSGGGTGGGGGSGGGSITTTSTTSVQPKISQLQVSFNNRGNVIITWLTDIDSDSQVDFGLSSNLGVTKTTSLLTKTHAIELENLLAQTQYYYSVSSKTSTGVREYSNKNTFVTPKPLPQCSDTLDNDGDGLFDLDDPGCVDSQDNNELDEQTPSGFNFFTAKKAIFQITLLAVLTLTIVVLGFVTYSSWVLFARKKK